MKKLLAMLLMCTAMGVAQSKDETKPPNIYKIDFSVMEVQNGKRSNIRNYTMYVKEGNRGYNTKVGNRVPVLAGKEGTVQYMDVGLQLSCTVTGEKNGAAILEFNFELASLVAPEATTQDHGPLVRQVRQDGVAQLPLGKPTMIVSADDTNTSRTVQVEVTATLVK